MSLAKTCAHMGAGASWSNSVRSTHRFSEKLSRVILMTAAGGKVAHLVPSMAREIGTQNL